MNTLQLRETEVTRSAAGADINSYAEKNQVADSVTFYEDSGCFSFIELYGRGESFMHIEVGKNDWKIIFSSLMKDKNFAAWVRRKVLAKERRAATTTESIRKK